MKMLRGVDISNKTETTQSTHSIQVNGMGKKELSNQEIIAKDLIDALRYQIDFHTQKKIPVPSIIFNSLPQRQLSTQSNFPNFEADLLRNDFENLKGNRNKESYKIENKKTFVSETSIGKKRVKDINWPSDLHPRSQKAIT